MFSKCFPKDNILSGPKLKQTINRSMGEFYFSCCKSFGDEICQVDADSGITETYSSVKRRSTRLALELQKRGITSECVVATCTKATLDTIIPILACFFIGATITNFDVSLSVRHIAYLLGLVTPKLIFVEESSVILIEESLKSADLKASIVVFGKSQKYPTFSEFLKPHSMDESFEPVKMDINAIASIFYSSGTAGQVKPVCHSHFSFLNIVYSCHQTGLNFSSIFTFGSFYWISTLITMSCAMLSGGLKVFSNIFEAKTMFHIIQKYKVTYMFMAPLLTYRLTNFDHLKDYNISSLQHIILTGTPTSRTQFQKLSATFKHVKIGESYGLTEGGVVSLYIHKKFSDLKKARLNSCGKLLPGVSIKILDLDTNEALGPNRNGEICVKSGGIMKGYYKIAITPNKYDMDGFLKTGDIGYYDKSHNLYIIDRVKEMFKYMNWHIIPAVIETVLMEHPAVKEAVVFGIPISKEEGEKPAACVVLKEDCDVSSTEIEEFVAERVSDREKLIGGVWFTKTLPKTPAGKLIRKEIRNHILSTL